MPHEHAGHRKRILQRLETGAVVEPELMEIMLFPLLPRKNTSDLAHRLISRFGSVYAVYCASIDELREVDGVGESVAHNIYCTGLVFRKFFLKESSPFLGVFSSERFLEYAKSYYEEFPLEIADVYLLDEKGAVSKKYRFTDYGKFSVDIEGEAFAKILDLATEKGIVLVHTHPQSPSFPSEQDDETTKLCLQICQRRGIRFQDHFIRGADGVFSYRLQGRLQTEENP